MQRKVAFIWRDDQFEDELYPAFKEGWKLDPWLHPTGRPWTQDVEVQGCTEDDNDIRTGYFFNLIKLEQTDSVPIPTAENDGELAAWVFKNSPLIGIDKLSLKTPTDPILDEKQVEYHEVSGYVLQGYEAPPDLTWAKNRLVRLRKSAVLALAAGGVTQTIKDILDKIALNDLADYLKAREEYEHVKKDFQG